MTGMKDRTTSKCQGSLFFPGETVVAFVGPYPIPDIRIVIYGIDRSDARGDTNCATVLPVLTAPTILEWMVF